MGGGDGVEVSREVEIDLVHWQHLRITASCRTAFHAEARTHGGLTECQSTLVTQTVHRHGEAHTHRGLANAGLGGRHGGHQYHVAAVHLALVDTLQWHFGYVLTVMFQLVGIDAHALGYLRNGLQHGLACNLNITFHSQRVLINRYNPKVLLFCLCDGKNSKNSRHLQIILAEKRLYGTFSAKCASNMVMSGGCSPYLYRVGSILLMKNEAQVSVLHAGHIPAILSGDDARTHGEQAQLKEHQPTHWTAVLTLLSPILPLHRIGHLTEINKGYEKCAFFRPNPMTNLGWLPTSPLPHHEMEAAR